MALVLLALFLPWTALASENPEDGTTDPVPVTPYDVWVNNIQVTSANKDDVLGDLDEGATATFDGNGTLTLNGASLNSDNGVKDYAVIYSTTRLTVKLVGSNSITLASGETGILVNTSSLTVNGDSLEVTGGMYGLRANGESLSIDVSALTTEGTEYPLSTNDASCPVSIRGGAISLKSCCNGITGGRTDIYGGSLQITGVQYKAFAEKCTFMAAGAYSIGNSGCWVAAEEGKELNWTDDWEKLNFYAEIGSKGGHNPDNTNYTYTNNTDGTHTKTCADCGTVLSEPEHHTYGATFSTNCNAPGCTKTRVVYDVAVGGITINEDNKDDVQGAFDTGATVTYNPEGEPTLTLNGAEVMGTITSGSGLTINVQGDSRIAAKGTDTIPDGTGIYIRNAGLTIEGSGTLTIDAGCGLETPDNYSVNVITNVVINASGLFADTGYIFVGKGGTLTVQGYDGFAESGIVLGAYDGGMIYFTETEGVDWGEKTCIFKNTPHAINVLDSMDGTVTDCKKLVSDEVTYKLAEVNQFYPASEAEHLGLTYWEHTDGAHHAVVCSNCLSGWTEKHSFPENPTVGTECSKKCDATYQEYGVTVGSTAITSANADDVLGDDTVSYHAGESTLTLKGAGLSFSTITANGDLTIDLQGDKRNQVGSVQVSGNLLITGSNSIIVAESGGFDYALVAGGTVTIDANVSMQGNKADVKAEKLVVKGGTATLQGLNSTYASEGADIEVNGGRLVISSSLLGKEGSKTITVTEDYVLNPSNACEVKGEAGTVYQMPWTEGSIHVKDTVDHIGTASSTYKKIDDYFHATYCSECDEPVDVERHIFYDGTTCGQEGCGATLKTFNIWVSGVRITNANAGDVLNDGTVSYDPENNTLTLNGYVFDGQKDKVYEESAIRAYNDLNVMLGENASSIGLASGTYGIQTSGVLKISGGKLTVNGYGTATIYGFVTNSGTIKEPVVIDADVSISNVSTAVLIHAGTNIAARVRIDGGQLSITNCDLWGCQNGFVVAGGKLIATGNYEIMFGESGEIQLPNGGTYYAGEDGCGIAWAATDQKLPVASDLKYLVVDATKGAQAVHNWANADLRYASNEDGTTHNAYCKQCDVLVRENEKHRFSDQDDTICDGEGCGATRTLYNVWVGSARVSSLNKDNVLNDGTVSYDPENNTLTLNGAYIAATYSYDSFEEAAIYSAESLTVNMTNTTINTSYSGIYCGGNLTVNMTGGDEGNEISVFDYGIAAAGALNVTLTGVNEIGGAASGIYSDQSTVTITQNAGTTSVRGSASSGIYSGGAMSISGSGTIYAKGDGAAIDADGGLTIGGTVTVGAEGSRSAFDGTVTVTGDYTCSPSLAEGACRVPQSANAAPAFTGAKCVIKVGDTEGEYHENSTYTDQAKYTYADNCTGKCADNNGADATHTKRNACCGTVADAAEEHAYSADTLCYQCSHNRAYVVTFDFRGGAFAVSTETFALTDSNDKLPQAYLPLDNTSNYAVVKVGRIFGGWYMDENFTQRVTIDTVFSANTTIYAQWTLCDHYVNSEAQPTDCINAVNCTVCGAPFKQPHEYSSSTRYARDEEYHWKLCKYEGCTEEDTANKTAHEFSDWEQDGQGHHSHKCPVCTFAQSLECSDGQNDGTATCRNKAVCETCKKEYGDKNPNNHALTTFKYTFTADQHTKLHACCEVEVAATTESPNPANHAFAEGANSCSADCGFVKYATIMINGTQMEVNSANMNDLLGNGTVQYIPADPTAGTPQTIILNNAKLQDYVDYPAAIGVSGDLKLVLKGENKINAGFSGVKVEGGNLSVVSEEGGSLTIEKATDGLQTEVRNRIEINGYVRFEGGVQQAMEGIVNIQGGKVELNEHIEPIEVLNITGGELAAENCTAAGISSIIRVGGSYVYKAGDCWIKGTSSTLDGSLHSLHVKVGGEESHADGGTYTYTDNEDGSTHTKTHSLCNTASDEAHIGLTDGVGACTAEGCGFTAYPVWVAGTQVTSLNQDNVPGATAGTITYTPADTEKAQKLELNGVTISESSYGIKATADLDIVLTGTSTITTPTGVGVDGNLNISGDGTLNLSGCTTGVAVGTNTIAIKETVVIEMDGVTNAFSGSVRMDGGKLVVEECTEIGCNIMIGSESYAVSAGNCMVLFKNDGGNDEIEVGGLKNLIVDTTGSAQESHALTTFTYSINDDGSTHTKRHECCGTLVNDKEPHYYGENGEFGVCQNCGYVNAYVVTFEPAGGTITDSASLINLTAQTNTDRTLNLTALPVATKVGYLFNGWSLPDGTLLSLETQFSANTTVSAQWIECDHAGYAWIQNAEKNSDGLNTHTRTCGACAQVDTELCSGGTATCLALAVCDGCKQTYGELDGNTHESTEFEYDSIGISTHGKSYACCGAMADGAEKHSFRRGECEHCGALRAFWPFGYRKHVCIWSESRRAHAHVLVYRSAREKTCLTDGNKEYWFCGSCGRYYDDDQGEPDVRVRLNKSDIIDEARGYHVYENGVCECGAKEKPSYSWNWPWWPWVRSR